MNLRSLPDRKPFLTAALALVTLAALVAAAISAEPRAKDLFGTKKLPAVVPAQSFGFYSKGCFAGGVALPMEGPTWEVMRPSRNRRWGHPAMIALIEKLSRDAGADGWPGLLVGDVSQPRGGPMMTGHASHQIGLDADIWLTPMPKRPLSMAQRESMSATLMVDEKTHLVKDALWTPAHTRLLKRAASYPEVERILVNPGIKKELCDTVTGDRSWLRKIRPFWGHDYHFHMRIGCQPGSPGCKGQEATPADDGCGKPLAWWFTEEPWRPNKNPDAPKARDLMTMANLPKECQAVLAATDAPSLAAVTYQGGSATAVAVAEPQPTEPAETISSGNAAMPAAASAFAPTPKIGIPLPRPRPGN
ncbi:MULTISPECIES: penicillin-insensitive murein endopeptidase [unclassified Mesorhizobium]|uniref:penicillin-insensitive murein endopeptidase n=1 Tax=unclassified Mesorhizobium TaxID=325217 RepID=UPI000F750CFF|nr:MULTISPECIES: penicillin-insensitive murein endopeptidase [unclassified Mesorhizobium]AZO04262.1 penicillin-insensitive murein endopeptidase [Mesorhizobium sp. M2A.F.Ca.ET.043.02.1.1]RUW33799.1 penicillin-insensitive murein endopeptidase [Mesorhizobium sp. M2A.F.Ca.ET.015.02.1.1]RUW77364.1 penicillin-insensitive murein endopeptidase [Mesorhizobium sp. M2A.F.Ca.ET.067.02.1.1]RVC92812.1 penicillin-insensitive murein endopeptidase [Mesorhizobium sp. M2A.F.Ca.ET.017.03.2.1]RVD01456.1 penicillin